MTTDHMELRARLSSYTALGAQEMPVPLLDLAELLAAYDALRAGTTVKRGKKEYPVEFSAAYDAMKEAGAKWREGSTLAATYDQWKKRIKAGADPEQMLEGARRYGAYIKATAGEPKMAQTFFGPGEHYSADWSLPTARTANRIFPGRPSRQDQQQLANEEALRRLDGIPAFDPTIIDMEASNGSR